LEGDFSASGNLVRGFLEVAAVVGEVTGCFKVLAVEVRLLIEGGHYGLEEGSKGGRAGNSFAGGWRKTASGA